jgi:hypothetical protein
MANYYLKNADATRMFRVDYSVDENGGVSLRGTFACATGASAELPNKNPIVAVDAPVDPAQLLIDVVLNGLVEGTVTEYRTLAKAMTDLKWS